MIIMCPLKVTSHCTYDKDRKNIIILIYQMNSTNMTNIRYKESIVIYKGSWLLTGAKLK